MSAAPVRRSRGSQADTFAALGVVLGALRRAFTAVLLAPVHLWRMTAVFRQPRCRYYPSCSTYALGAVRVHGPLRGGALAAGRVLRCHPWSPGGIDHVPPVRPSVRRSGPSSLQSPVQSSAQAFGVRDA